MSKTLVLVHTVRPLVEPFTVWCAELLPGVRVVHVLDEAIGERIRLHGPMRDRDAERLAEHLAIAEEIGADVVLVTCSVLSHSVDPIRHRFRVPIVKIDDAMAAEAVRRGGRVAVLATSPTALGPSRALLEEWAARTGTAVQIELRLVDDALAALYRGDGQDHDVRVAACVRDFATRADTVVLAQASMARVLDTLDPPPPVPVLTSPRLALREVALLLAPRDR